MKIVYRHEPVLVASGLSSRGEWRVACDACSAAAGHAVYPCRESGRNDSRRWPRTQWLQEIPSASPNHVRASARREEF